MTRSVNYKIVMVPGTYFCSKCNAKGVKLWRPYNSFNIRLLCADCAAEDQGKDISSMDEYGSHESKLSDGTPAGKCDQIGWFVPAVPTEDAHPGFKDSLAYWGYTSVPQEGVDWWKRLSNRQESS